MNFQTNYSTQDQLPDYNADKEEDQNSENLDNFLDDYYPEVEADDYRELVSILAKSIQRIAGTCIKICWQNRISTMIEPSIVPVELFSVFSFFRYGERTHDTHKNEELRSKLFNGKYDDIEERSQDESDEGEQGGRHSISIDDSDTNLPIADDHPNEDSDMDFHEFWKGNENAWAIREAQGTSATLVTLITLRNVCSYAF